MSQSLRRAAREPEGCGWGEGNQRAAPATRGEDAARALSQGFSGRAGPAPHPGSFERGEKEEKVQLLGPNLYPPCPARSFANTSS